MDFDKMLRVDRSWTRKTTRNCLGSLQGQPVCYVIGLTKMRSVLFFL